VIAGKTPLLAFANSTASAIPDTGNDMDEPGLFAGAGMELLFTLSGRVLCDVGAPIVHDVVAIQDVLADLLK